MIGHYLLLLWGEWVSNYDWVGSAEQGVAPDCGGTRETRV